MMSLYYLPEIFLLLVTSAGAVYEQNPFFQQEIKPSTTQSTPGLAVTQPTTTSTTTKEPIFTIEPPEILYGGDLNRFCLQPTGQFPSKGCNKYVNCWQGIAIEQSCPEGLLFSPIKLYCDYSQNVDCQGKAIIDTSASLVPTTAPSSPAAVGASLRKFCLRPTGLFPGSSCSKFVNCWGDNTVEQDCPEGLHFSTEGYCDYPVNVNCVAQDDKHIPENFFASVTSECPLEFGTFRDKTNCSQYYTCAYNKIAARYECPDGLSFSDILGLCDYSYRVDCTKEPQIFQRKIEHNMQDMIAQVQNCTPGTVFALNPQCTSACRCREGVAEIIQCPSGFAYDIQLDKCLPLHLARC
ncbi:peritrophin-44-like isoform X2 [Anthonomus grandis grandis]|uniref:peritrophin-44-like isoform X2 n=1 Tax=Anthonomus grandis grandis TaxID=2921223 RepID=UPI0021668EF9|nr:peritrophin-44-like isoform X2 [Anthonomus grandis grandis]